MNLRKRLFAVLLLMVMIAGAVYAGHMGMQRVEEEEKANFLKSRKDTITVWYTDDSLTDYLNASALEFQQNRKVRVEPVLKSGKEFLEEVNAATFSEDEVMPDVILVTNDTLEKAYLAGFASEIQDAGNSISEENFPKAAVSAVTYKDKKVAYPLYYETSALIYNKTYLEEYAAKRIQQEADLAAAEASQAAADEGDVEEEAAGDSVEVEITPEMQQQWVIEHLPSTIEDLETLANEYDAPEQVEGFFKWDVSDILYNYTFAGGYMSVGGENGDREDQIDIYNLETIQCMKIFQDLNQFFFIEVKNSDYETVMNDFIAGKMVFTVGGTDAIKRIETAKAEGNFPYEYGVMSMPDLNAELKSRSRSITNVAAVNGYSKYLDKANDYARFLSTQFGSDLYLKTGKVAASNNVVYDEPALEVYREEYNDSIAMPKLMSTGNFWIKLEIAFTDIWQGADVNATLKALSEEMMTQITGEAYEEELIEVPVEEVPVEEETVDESETQGE